MRWSPDRPGRSRAFGACLLTLTLNMGTFPLAALPSSGSSDGRFGQEGSVKVRIADSEAAQRAQVLGARLVADYEGFKVLEVPRHALSGVANMLKEGGGQILQEENLISLNSDAIDTTQRAVKDRMGTLATSGGKGLHLIQFAGPIKPEWYAALASTGVRIVNYIPSNAYMVYGDSSQLAAVAALKGSNSFVQWDGAYEAPAKLHRNVRERLKAQTADKPGTPAETLFSIQLVEDPAVNPDTLALLENLKVAGTSLRVWSFLGFVNVRGDFDASLLEQIAGRPEVVSIQAAARMKKMDERQAQIMAGNLTAGIPNAASYSTQLASWGFTQTQFNTSNFAVDITDDGLDNGLTNVNNPQLHESGVYGTSRVIYNGVQSGTTFGAGQTGTAGHGNLNTGIVGGFVPVAFGAAFPHGDSLGFRYGQGIAPFVKLAQSTVFTIAGSFTNPDYPAMLSRGYNSGTRISSNSWGAPVAGAYDGDAQAYDALVRDAQPTGSAFPAAGNQEMVIVFSAGNDGSVANSIGTPGTGKNVFTIGAAENVHSHATAAGGNNAAGNDGCNLPDTGADNANDVISFSSRGPCDDSRVKPDIQAPGTHVTGPVWQFIADPANNGSPNGTSPSFTAAGVCGLPGSGTAGDPDNFFPLGQQWYSTSSGTSHSCPAVAGASALVRQYFINQAWGAPSPAMNKAYLMNSTRYMTGVSANDTLPSNSQGMGEVNLGTAFDGVARVRSDQVGALKLTATGQTRTFVGQVQDATKPFRVTLGWTDAPGATSGNAYNNNLDLSVTVGGNTYLGNVFSGANSATGGTADPRNNVENVFVPAGLAVGTPYIVTVTGANIVSDGVPNDGDPLDQDFALIVYNAAAASLPVVGISSSTITAESCVPANSAPDPAELVTYSICLQNVGTADTTNLVGTMPATGGVTSPSGPQNYGVLVAGGPAVCRSFTYTVDAGVSCGNSVAMTLQLQDGASNLGTVTSNVVTGTRPNFLSQNFDGVTPPALPAGWTATNASGAAPLWVTSTTGGTFGSDTAPNYAFVDDPGAISDKLLDLAVTLPGGQTQLNFRHRYNLESTFDGGVLEISVNGGAFSDIVTAGGTFVAGGYSGTISTNASFGSPILGRSAWTGNSGAYITTTVNLPLAAQGQPIVLRFRMGSDNGVSGTGWAIDTVTLSAPVCTCVASPPLINETAFAWQPGETCTPANSVPDPGENVTYRLSLQNVGGSNTANLIVTLQASGGVVASVARTYGVVVAGAPAVFQDFTFQVSNAVTCGGSVTATFTVADGAMVFPNIVHVLTTGTTTSSGPTNFSNTNQILIPAGQPGTTSGVASPYPSGISVAGLTGTVSKVTVDLNAFNHTFPTDVDVLLVGPAGQKVIIMSDAGSSTDAVNANLVLDDAAASSLPTTGAIVSGTFKPTNIGTGDTFTAPAPAAPYGALLSDFNGTDPNGTWNLYVMDDLGGDFGNFSSGWGLSITTASPVCSTTCAAAGPPTITPTPGGITVAQGTTTNNVQIAVVSDPDTPLANLVVTALTAPSGITIANIVVNGTTGAVTATIVATCAAAPTGTATLQVTDGTTPVQGILTVNTTAVALPATLTGGATLCAGESTTLTLTLTGTAPWTVTWSDGFVQNVAASPATRVVTPAVTTTYTITSVVDASGCAGTPTGSALVTVNPRPTATVTGGGTICAGTVATVTATLTGTAPWTILWNDGIVQVAAASPATRLVSPTFNQIFAVASLSDAKCGAGTSTGAAVFVVKPLASAVITAANGVCFSSTGNVASVPDGGLGVTYAWTISGGTITSATNTNSITYTANASGNVVLTVTVTKDGCPNVGTKTIPIETTPTAPVPAIPANGSTYSGAFVSWTHAGGTWYDVYLDTVPSPEKLIFSGQTSNFEAFIPSWVPGVTYYWKVVARNGCGTASSPVWSFVAGNCLWTGTGPTLVSPSNGATGIGPNATLTWTSVPGTAHYDVYIGTSAGTMDRYDVAQAPEISVVVPVSPGTTYYWKVIAVPVCGSAVAATSSTNSFTTGGTALGMTAFSPTFFNRWETGTVTLTGSGFTAAMGLFTDLDGTAAGTLIPAVFTNSFSNPTQLQATLIGNPVAQAGRYDVGVVEGGLEKGRLHQKLALRAFTDVTENDYYYLSTARMADAGIMESDFSAGTAGPQFSPTTNVTRALMAEYLAKSYQYWRTRTTALPPATCVPAGAGSTDFPDVACSHENWLAIHWIKVWGVTTGSPCPDGLCFNPTGSVNRAEMVTFIERLRQTGVLGTLLSTVGEKDPGCATNYPACKGWSDAGGVMDVAAWPRREANLAFQDRITSGCGGTVGNNLTFCPYDVVTRGQIGEFLARTLGLVSMP